MSTARPLVSPPVTYMTPYFITVRVDETDPTKPTVWVADEDKVLIVQEPEGSGPHGIRWILHNDHRAKWSLAAIEWVPGKENANANPEAYEQFEADINMPGAGVVINLIDHFKDKKTASEEERSYAYKIWVTPKKGMGTPIYLDPVIRNDPQ